MKIPRLGIAAVLGAVSVFPGCAASLPTAQESASYTLGASPGWPSWETVDVVAHRGYACCFPENTLEAIGHAIELGAGAVEIDVQFSRDGVPVLIHDIDLDRTTDRRGRVVDYGLAELSGVNACPARLSFCALPTLRDALELARGRVLVVLDIKSSSTKQGIVRIFEDVEASGMNRDVAIISANLATLVWARASDRRVPIGLYIDVPPGGVQLAWAGKIIEELMTLGGSELLLRADEIAARGQLYESAVSRGMPIAAWTAHSVGQLRALLSTPGVTRVMSDVAPR